MADMNDLQNWAAGKTGQEEGATGTSDGADESEGEEQDDITPADALQGACMELREAADYLERALKKMDEPGDLQEKLDEFRATADELETQAAELREEEEEEGDEEDEDDEDGEGDGGE